MELNFVDSLFEEKRKEAKGGYIGGAVFLIVALVLLSLYYVFSHGVGWAIAGYFFVFVSLVLFANALKLSTDFERSKTKSKLQEFGDPQSLVQQVNSEFISGVRKDNIDIKEIHGIILESLKKGSTPAFQPFLFYKKFYVSPSWIVVNEYGKDPVIFPRESIGIVRMTVTVTSSYGEEISRTYSSEFVVGDQTFSIPSGFSYEETLDALRDFLALTPWAYLQNPPEEAYQSDRGVQRVVEGARKAENLLLGKLWWLSPYGWVMKLGGRRTDARATIKKVYASPLSDRLSLRKLLLIKMLKGEDIQAEYSGEVESLKYNLDFISGKVNQLP